MKNVTILLAVLAVVAMAAPAGAVNNTFIGGYNANDWNTAANWDQNRVPSTVSGISDTVLLGNGLTANINTAATPGPGTLYSVLVGSPSGDAVLNIKANIANNGWGVFTFGTGAGTIVVNHTAGALTAMGNFIQIGTLGQTGTSTYNVSGSATIGPYTDIRMQVRDDGATFSVDGASVSINLREYTSVVGSNTKFKLTAAGTVSPIKTTHGGGTTTPLWAGYMRGTLTIDDSLWTTPTLGYRVVLFATPTAGTAYNHYQAFTSGNPDWAIGYNSTTREVYGESLVPEPATMVLLGLGGIGVLIRRRRK